MGELLMLEGTARPSKETQLAAVHLGVALYFILTH